MKIAFKKLKLHRIEAGIEKDNKASIAVAKGVGMKSEGVRKRIVYEDGEWRDLLSFVMTAEDLGIKNVKPSRYVDFGEILSL